MLVHSAEARWFFRGEPPGPVLRAFASAPPGDERTDLYVALADCDATAVKLREGKLEIKARRAALGPAQYAPGVVGLAETWLKWSLALPDRDTLDREAARDAPVPQVAIRKRRRLRTFSLDPGHPEEVPPEAQPAQPCAVELTTITGPDAHAQWWSIGLEAAGLPGGAENALRATAAHLFADPAPAWHLGVEASMSYPAWLARTGAWPTP